MSYLLRFTSSFHVRRQALQLASFKIMFFIVGKTIGLRLSIEQVHIFFDSDNIYVENNLGPKVLAIYIRPQTSLFNQTSAFFRRLSCVSFEERIYEAMNFSGNFFCNIFFGEGKKRKVGFSLILWQDERQKHSPMTFIRKNFFRQINLN